MPQREPSHAHILTQRVDIDDPTSSIAPPIYPSTTYARDNAHALPTVGPGGATLCYARPDNPTLRLPERMLAELEGGDDAALFASGMAAVTCVLNAVVRKGEIVLCPRRGYFAVRARIREWCEAHGAEVVHYDPEEYIELPEEDVTTRGEGGRDRDVPVEKAPPLELPLSMFHKMFEAGRTMAPVALVWIESPANPTWDAMNITAVSTLAKEFGVRCVCVDSTVMTPICSKPLSLGADIVMHSATKYLNGHGDVLAGALVTKRKDEVWTKVLHERKLGGAVLGSFDAYLLTRGMRTLELRVRHQSESALWLAKELSKAIVEKKVKLPSSDGAIVLYPGLEPTPEFPRPDYVFHKINCPYGYYGGMLSVVFLVDRRQGQAKVKKPRLAKECAHFAANCRNWTCATSLGGFESLIEHRYSVEFSGPEYRNTPDDKQERRLVPHVPVGLLRLSVGLEKKEDLLRGFLQSLVEFKLPE